MSIPKSIGLVIALLFSFVTLVVFLLGLMISAHEPGRHSVFQWAIGVTIASLPFLFTFWIVYHCFCTDEMPAVEILGCIVRPRAFWRAVRAELYLLVIIVATYLIIMFGSR